MRNSNVIKIVLICILAFFARACEKPPLISSFSGPALNSSSVAVQINIDTAYSDTAIHIH